MAVLSVVVLPVQVTAARLRTATVAYRAVFAATRFPYILVGTFSWSPDAFQAGHLAAAARGRSPCSIPCAGTSPRPRTG